MTFDLSLDKHSMYNIVQIKKHPSKMLLCEGLSQAAYLQNGQLQSNVVYEVGVQEIKG